MTVASNGALTSITDFKKRQKRKETFEDCKI